MGETAHFEQRKPEKIIYQGNDADRIADLSRALDIAERVAERGGEAARLGDVLPSADAAREELEAFAAEAAERAFVIRYQHIGRKRFRDLVLAHPARMVDAKPDEGDATDSAKQAVHPDDEGWGFNTETLPDALLAFRDNVTRTIVEPDLDEAGLRNLLDVELSEGDYADLWQKVYFLNAGGSADPKAVMLSLASRTSSGTSGSADHSV